MWAATTDRQSKGALGSNTIWVDLNQLPDVLFFEGLLAGLDEEYVETTARRREQTVELAQRVGFEPEVIGRDFDTTIARRMGIPYRTSQLLRRMPDCDIALSARNAMSVLAARFHGIPSIHFTDNDITAHTDGLWAEQLYNRLEAVATHTVVPEPFDTGVLADNDSSAASIHTYNGYKEDVYIAAFEPDPTFPNRLPFEEYVVVRPEALTAAYVGDVESLVPSLFEALVKEGHNVVYLPRGRGDAAYATPYPDDQVFVPDDALHGLQLVWHSRCVLTGSGTMGREAACMEKPAVSFFPSELLSVDRELVSEDRLFHSRDPDAITAYVTSLSHVDITPNRQRARGTREEIIEIVRDIVQAV